MNQPFLLTIAAVLLLAGCGDKSATSSTGATNAASSGASPMNAPAAYLQGLSDSKQKAVKVADTTGLDQALQLFSGEKGRYPKDLNELVTEKYISKIPDPPYGMKFDYDSTAGIVRVVPK